MSRALRVRAIAGTVGIALLMGAPAALADTAESEPNDSIAGAQAITSSDASTGSFGTASDVDWFVFQAPAGTSTVSLTKTGSGCSAGVDWNVLDANGNDVAAGTHTTASDATDTETVSGGGRFYVKLTDDCQGDPYKLTVSPVAGAIAPDDAGPSASPSPTYDQNDDIAHAMGPLAAGTAYAGGSSTAADVDWYSLHVTRAGAVRATVTKVGPGCSADVAWNVLDGDGKPVIPAVRTTASDTVGTAYFNAPGPGRYYVVVTDECAGDSYQLRAGPPDALTTANTLAFLAPTPVPQETQEPNQTIATAYGPLSASVQYGGVISAATDVDLFYVFAAAGKPIELAVTKVGPGCGGAIATQVIDGASKVLAAGTVASNTTTHLTFTSPTSAQVYVRVTGTCAGDAYQMHLLPNGALLAQFPKPTQAKQPNQAKRNVNKAKISLKHTTKRTLTGKLVTNARCQAARKVTLRWETHGKKAYARVKTRSNGKFTIKLKRTFTGRVYVYTPRFENSARVCQAATSKKLRF